MTGILDVRRRAEIVGRYVNTNKGLQKYRWRRPCDRARCYHTSIETVLDSIKLLMLRSHHFAKKRIRVAR